MRLAITAVFSSIPLYASENGFHLVKCLGCGLLYVTPRPTDDELAKAHECGVHHGESSFDITGSFVECRVQAYLPVLRDLYGDELSRRDRSWLDIGCGHGEFLVALDQFSSGRVRGRGVEPNRHKQASASAWGLDVSYFDLKEHSDRYDALSLLNVYSHLSNPPEFLMMCKELLRPAGELLLQTGDTADLAPTDHYRPLFLPDHLSFASKRIVTDILLRSGFRIMNTKKYPVVPFRCSRSHWLKEVVKIFWPGKQSELGRLVRNWKKHCKYTTDMYIRAKLRE